MLRVAIRVDGGRGIGMGHIMRCLSLAKEFRKKSCDVYFISRYQSGIDKIRDEGFRAFKLSEMVISPNQYFDILGTAQELDSECNSVIAAVRALKTDLLVVDTYNVTEEYFLKIKANVKKLIYIDDLCKSIYPVDVLINGNITGPYLNYEKYNKAEVLLLGTEYNLIRDEFRDLPVKEVRDRVQEIMITTGGTDPYNLSARLINLILSDKELGDLKIHIIVGNGFNNSDELKEISRRYDNVVLHENVDRMSGIMLRSDIAVSAGGSTLYELCSCGTPTAAFIMVDNQEFIVEKLYELGYIRTLGWYDGIGDNLVNEIKNLARDYKLRKKLSIEGRNLVDARGAERIVACILELMNQ